MTFVKLFLAFLAFGFVGEVFANEYPYPMTTYNVWCSPQSDTCSYTDLNEYTIEIPRKDLPDVFPMIEGGVDCIWEFCYNTDGDVIGLNPDNTW